MDVTESLNFDRFQQFLLQLRESYAPEYGVSDVHDFPVRFHLNLSALGDQLPDCCTKIIFPRPEVSMSFVDLHVHSTASDGLLTPSELVNLASDRGLSVLSLTDHDTLDGIEEAFGEAIDRELLFIPSLELSVDLTGGGSAHMLGYFPFTPIPELLSEETPLGKAIELVKRGREERNPAIIRILCEMGMELNLSDVRAKAGDGIVGRPHIADVLVDKGYVESTNEAFERFLAKGKPAYVDRTRLFALRALDLISGARGIPVLAHPGLMQREETGLRALIRSLTDNGLQGLEVYYPSHTRHITRWLTAESRKMGLLLTGGTDFHGRKQQSIQPGGTSSGFNIEAELVSDFLERCFPRGELDGKAE